MGEALGTALLYGLLAFGVIGLIGLIGIGLLAAGGIALAAGAAAAKVLLIVGGFFAGISLLFFCEAFDVDVFSWVGDLAYEIKTPALVKAADEENVEKVTLLLKKGKNPNKKSHGRTALGAACMHHSESSAEIVRMLLEAGANPNEKSKESQENKYELHYGKKDSNGKYKSAPQFPLECAIDSFNYDAVRLLAKNGAVIDTLPNSDWQPVQYSLFYARSREAALILLEEGANPGYWYDEAQKITLMMKVCDDSVKVNPKILDALLALGSDVNAVDENAHSALFYCGEPSGFTLRPENVEWLVAHGADVNLEDNDGVTPIIYFFSVGEHAARTADNMIIYIRIFFMSVSKFRLQRYKKNIKTCTFMVKKWSPKKSCPGKRCFDSTFSRTRQKFCSQVLIPRQAINDGIHRSFRLVS